MSLVGPSIVAACSAMGKVVCVFAIGLIAARFPRPKGMLPPAFLAHVSVLTFYLLAPCLLLSNLSKQLNPSTFMELWPLVLWAFCFVTIGLVLGIVLFRLVGVREEYIRTLAATVGHSNAVSFPLIALDSLTSAPMFDSIPDAYSRAMSVVFIYATGWNIIFYAFTYPYVSASKREEPDQVDSAPAPAIQQQEAQQEVAVEAEQGGCRGRMKRAWDMFWTIFLNPNMLAATASFIIAFTPLLKHQMFTPGTVLRPLMQAIEFLGSGAIPLGSLVMAGNVSESLRRNFGIGGPKDVDVAVAEQHHLDAALAAAAEVDAGNGGQDGADAAVEMQSLPSGPFSRLVDDGSGGGVSSSGASVHHSYARARGNGHKGSARPVPLEPAGRGASAPWAGAAVVGLEDIIDDSDDDERNEDEESAVGRRSGRSRLGDSSDGFGAGLGDDRFQSPYSSRGSVHFAPATPTSGRGVGSMGSLAVVSEGIQGVRDDTDGPATLAALRSLPPLDVRSGLTYQRELRLERTVSLKAGAGVPAPPLRVTVATVAMSPRSAAIRAALPDPRLTVPQLVAAIVAKLVLVPAIAFVLVGAVRKAGWTWLLPDDPVLRVVLLLIVLAPSAESVLVVVTKAGMRRQAMAVSLVYLVQIAAVIITAAVGITLSLVLFF